MSDRARNEEPGREAGGAVTTHCPLCGLRFRQDVEHCVACPAHARCAVVCCPRCGYQFVERSAILDWLGRLARRWRGKRSGPGRTGGKRA